MAESIALAPNQPKDALVLAELALHIAERIPGEQTLRWRFQGLSWAMIANARRVLEDLHGADEALARAAKLWEDGAPGDPGLLNEAWLPWIEANLRRAQRRFPLALKKIEEALALDNGELRGKILISKSLILKFLGDPEGSTAVLEQAIPLIDTTREPRLAFGLRFNLLEDLCELGRAEEVAPRLPGVRRLAESLGEALDLTKVVWLEGKAAAGLERPAEALTAFEQARREFRSRDLYLLYALVSLDLALLLMEQGRTAEVRKTAEEMVFIFKAQGLKREALVALGFFCDAAQQEAATVELIRRVSRFLQLAELDAGLKFEGEG
jgi:tetratricopeptide (TPR) repeat protein